MLPMILILVLTLVTSFLVNIINRLITVLGLRPGPLWSNIALVWSWNIFWTRLGPCVAFALF